MINQKLNHTGVIIHGASKKKKINELRKPQ